MGVAFTTDPQKIYEVSLPEDANAEKLTEMAELLYSLVPEIKAEWEEFPPEIQDALTKLACRNDMDASSPSSAFIDNLSETDRLAVDAYFDANRQLREATLEAVEREKSRGPFREYTDEDIQEWEEADRIPPDLTEWVESQR